MGSTSVSAFLSSLELSRRQILSAIHQMILEADKQVTAEVAPMLGAEMIVYNQSGVFKYGLSSRSSYMSLYAMPIYGVPAIHSKYKKLLPLAKFQKGCINFKRPDDMPINVVRKLIEDCAKHDYSHAIELYKKRRK